MGSSPVLGLGILGTGGAADPQNGDVQRLEQVVALLGSHLSSRHLAKRGP